MKTNTKQIIVMIAICLGLMIPIYDPGAQARDHRALIAPIDTNPEGQTYGRWAAQWWQWALGVPAAVNPLPDTTGENCAQRQVDNVWFLAGSISSAPVVRACEVPAGKSLFLPLINNFYGAFLNDPPETRTEEFVRCSRELHGTDRDFGMDRWLQSPQADPVLYRPLGQPVAALQRAAAPG